MHGNLQVLINGIQQFNILGIFSFFHFPGLVVRKVWSKDP